MCQVLEKMDNMKALATAIINLAAFIELSSDETIDPDAAVAALEQLASDLQSAGTGEIEYLRAAIRQEIGNLPFESRDSNDHRRVEFLMNFIGNLGLPDA